MERPEEDSSPRKVGPDMSSEAIGRRLKIVSDLRILCLKLREVKKQASPLDVPSIEANISTREIVDIVREGRERDLP